ncbi:MAG: molybdopterin-dependent oxidoreductase [Anaerolineaceae bacterium]|nr:molybdopterin-dependent oxidoreductase [Anaerolineaceae bacterium]
MKRRDFIRLSVLFLAGCALPPKSPSKSAATRIAGPLAALPTAVPPEVVNCRWAPIVAPKPEPWPGLDQLDANGLHVTARGVIIEPSVYRLRVIGLVDHPLNLTLNDLRCMPKMTAKNNMTCPGEFEDVTSFSGVPFKYLMGLAGVQKGAKAINMFAADNFKAYMNLEDAMQQYNYIAYQWQDQPLPILHGFPVRAVMATTFGYAWVKWLIQIQVT